jgi:hypothetical protein
MHVLTPSRGKNIADFSVLRWHPPEKALGVCRGISFKKFIAPSRINV